VRVPVAGVVEPQAKVAILGHNRAYYYYYYTVKGWRQCSSADVSAPVHQNPKGRCCSDRSVLNVSVAAALDAACRSAGYRQRLPILQKAVNFGVGFFQQGRQ
jgi:hypothetical protein